MICYFYKVAEQLSNGSVQASLVAGSCRRYQTPSAINTTSGQTILLTPYERCKEKNKIQLILANT